MNALTKKWQLVRVERAISKAQANEDARQDCFWPCVHLASNIAGSDTRLVWRIAKTRIRITWETLCIRVQMFFRETYHRRLRGMSKTDYKALLDKEFDEVVDWMRSK